MFDGVVEGFLGDAVDGLLGFERRVGLFAEGGLDVYVVARLDGGCLFFQGGY